MNLIELIKVIIFGIIEGVTEWLPISSTGHMILADELIKLKTSEAFWEMFLVVIQLGAIMAVVILYFNKLNPFSTKKTASQKKTTIELWLKVLVASVPAGIIGLAFDDWIDERFYNYITVAVMLILYGVFFIVIENTNKKEAKYSDSVDISYKTAFLIGIFQMLALIPGTSRSGATIIGAMILGLSRFAAAEFSFFLAIPAMFGASAYKLAKFGFDFTTEEILTLVIGMVVAFVVSIIAIKLLMDYIKKNNFKAFGYYRIGLGIIVILYFLFT